MPFDIQAEMDQLRETEVPFRGGIIKCKLYANGVPMATLEELRRSGGTPEEPRALARFIVEVVKEWDVLSGGKPVPLDIDLLMSWREGLLSPLAKALVDANGPNESSSATS